MSSKFQRLMYEICPFRIGNRVRVSPTYKYSNEWPDTYIVTGVRWAYQKGTGELIDISIASEEEIIERRSDTDGWRPDDLLPA